MVKFFVAMMIALGLGALALGDYEVKVVQAKAKACDSPSCD